MTGTLSCPDPATLQLFRAGQLPEPLAGQVMGHLSGCPACMRVVGLGGSASDDTPPPSVRTSRPDARLSRRQAGIQLCPVCGDPLRLMGGARWCIRCGIDPAERYDRQAAPPPPPMGFPYWAIPAMFGVLAIIFATISRQDFLESGKWVRVWWILLELVAGLLLYFVGHAWAILVTLRDWREAEMFKFIDPVTVWKYAFAHLRRTRIAVCLGAWGVTAILCGFVLLWVNDFAFKDRTKKNKNGVMVVMPPPPPTPTEDKDEDRDYPAVVVVQAANNEPPREVDVIDLYPPEDKPPRQPPPPLSEECVVIGYVPDPNDPEKISRVVLGIRGPDGSIRYAGTVPYTPPPDAQPGGDAARQFKPLVEKPAYLPDGLNAIPVEPSVGCRVNYAERDKNGVLKDAEFRGFERPPEQPEQPPK